MPTAKQLLKGAHRLRVLADHLRDNVPLHKFDMHEWVSSNVGSGIGHFDITRKMLRDPESPTTACAVSHACLIPAFNRLGFRLYMKPYFGISPGLKYEENSWCSVQQFFGLNSDEAEHLFSVYSYKDKKAPKSLVIRRIRTQAGWMEKEANELSTQGA